MKQIKRENIAQAIKREYTEAKNWCRQDFGRCYQMMLDTYDGDIWSDLFLTENDYKIYHSSSILSLDTEYGCGDEASYIADAIRKLKAAGWIIID